MKKFIVKTTKEFTYDEKGFITKEVVVREEYEQEVNTGGNITSATIKPSDYTKVTGDKPYTNATVKVDTNGITTTIQNTNKTISEIANEVKVIKDILDRDLKFPSVKISKFPKA
jgi:uncharacterized OB-fold protein